MNHNPAEPKRPGVNLRPIVAEIHNRQQRETLCILGGVDHCDLRSYGKYLDINGLVISD
jgi:hypothetical protein